MQEIKKPLRMRPECIMCLLKGKMELFPKDVPEEKKVEYMQRVMKEFSEMPSHYGAPAVVRTVNRIRKEMFGIVEDFTEIKTHFNQLMMEQVPMMEKNLSVSPDPIKLAIQYSITGNYIDFGVGNKVDESVLQKFIDEAKNIELNGSELNALREELSRAKSIVYLTDNCGEIVMDKMLMAEIKKLNPEAKITAMVRGADILNDATVVDASQVALHEVAQVVDNGNDIAGTCLDEISEEAREILETADVILSKGQANFETLQQCGLNVYYIFMCKCDMFARIFNVPKFTGMLINDKNCATI